MSVPKSLLIWVLLGVAASPGSRGAPVSFSCTFTEVGWDKDAWVLVKSPRWDRMGDWVQRQDCLENGTPEGAEPADLLGKLAPETYSSMVLKTPVSGRITITTISASQANSRAIPTAGPATGGGTPRSTDPSEGARYPRMVATATTKASMSVSVPMVIRM